MASSKTFKGANTKLVGNENLQVGDLPVHRNQLESISRWRLTRDEIDQINKTGDVWVSIMTGGAPQSPMKVSAFPLIEFRDEDGRIITGYDPDATEFKKTVRIAHVEIEIED